MLHARTLIHIHIKYGPSISFLFNIIIQAVKKANRIYNDESKKYFVTKDYI